MFGKLFPNIRILFGPSWPNREFAASLIFFLLIYEHSSTHCSNISTELTIDYSTDFTMHKIFQTQEALINWARELGKSRGFMIVIKKSDDPKSRRKKRKGIF